MYIYICLTPVCLLLNIYVYVLDMLYLCFTPASPLLMYVSAVILFYLYIHLYSCFTRTLLAVYVCVCRLTGLVECVEESEGLRRDGAWEHGVLQQRPAGEAPLHDLPHVRLLMHVGAAQASTRLQERQRVSTAEQVREMHAARASYHVLLPDLVSVCMAEEDA
jgi:hypothetical protein